MLMEFVEQFVICHEFYCTSFIERDTAITFIVSNFNKWEPHSFCVYFAHQNVDTTKYKVPIKWPILLVNKFDDGFSSTSSANTKCTINHTTILTRWYRIYLSPLIASLLTTFTLKLNIRENALRNHEWITWSFGISSMLDQLELAKSTKNLPIFSKRDL